MRRLGCLTPLGLMATLLTLIVVAGFGFASGGAMFNPGPLSTSIGAGQTLGGVSTHAQLDTHCAACHVDPWSSQTMNERCVDCHTDIQDQLNDATSLHAALPNATHCRACHTEHNGAQASLTRLNFQEFPHERMGFSLAAHVQRSDGQPFACADCHASELTGFDKAACRTCHAEYQRDFVAAHVTDFGNDCLACHDGVDQLSAFDHAATRFALNGKHVEVKCRDCHPQTRTMAGFRDAPQTCFECHQQDDEHDGRFGIDCAQCHTTDGWEGATFDHNLAAFQLTGAHINVLCEQCHANGVFKGTPQTCVACHAEPDAHRGQFGTDCAACHSTETWEGATFDHTFPLDHGEEGLIACETCHTHRPDYVSYTCYGCHEHQPDEIENKHREEGINDFADCAQCHATGRKEEGEREGEGGED